LSVSAVFFSSAAAFSSAGFVASVELASGAGFDSAPFSSEDFVDVSDSGITMGAPSGDMPSKGALMDGDVVPVPVGAVALPQPEQATAISASAKTAQVNLRIAVSPYSSKCVKMERSQCTIPGGFDLFPHRRILGIFWRSRAS
jgi:hypothetical protein